jgi:anti-sigma regulatory factor (Ser/Thr protein kinase)
MPANKIDKPIEIKIEIPTNANFISGIRDFTLAMIKNMTDFSEQWAYRFQSVVDELCNNAIEHGSSKDDKIYVTFITHPDQNIEIIIEDNGTNPDKKTAKQILEILEANKKKDIAEIGIRGRGLAFIVEQWTDELKIEDRPNGGIKITVKKSLHDPEFTQKISDPNDPTHIVLA